MRRPFLVLLLAPFLLAACQAPRPPERKPVARPESTTPRPAIGAVRASERNAQSGDGGLAPTAAALIAPSPAATAASPFPAAGPQCPAEMAAVPRPQGAFCIDRWEASLEVRRGASSEPWPSNQPVSGHEAELSAVSVAGRKPQGYINGVQAGRACTNAGKRLCTPDEWVRACRGPQGLLYPYGNERRRAVCNDRFKVLSQHPVVRLFDRFAPPGTSRASMWAPSWMNDPRLHELSESVEPAGNRPECRSAYGVYDLVGNLHEWVDDPEGTFVGGFFMDTFQNGEGCAYRTSAHGLEYRDYSTGFRCCADASEN